MDTAAAHMNEEALGKAVKRAIADGLATRDELFITTKVWVRDQKNEGTAYEAVKASLAKLDLEYVDLVLLHQALGDYFAAYRGISIAYKEGLTKAALELVSDAVAKEAADLGIKVMIVEPGVFRTNFYDPLAGTDIEIKDYADTAGKMRIENMVNLRNQPGDPERAGNRCVPWPPKNNPAVSEKR